MLVICCVTEKSYDWVLHGIPMSGTVDCKVVSNLKCGHTNYTEKQGMFEPQFLVVYDWVSYLQDEMVNDYVRQQGVKLSQVVGQCREEDRRKEQVRGCCKMKLCSIQS